jgi:hypothetical protein
VFGDLGEMDRSLDRLGGGYKMRDLLKGRRVSYGIVIFYRKYLIVSLLLIQMKE